MRKIFAAIVLVALAGLGLVAPAGAVTPGAGATNGIYTTVQTCSTAAGTHHFEYDYEVSDITSTQKKFWLLEARYSGPGTAGLSSGNRKWVPIVSTAQSSGSGTTSGNGWVSASGRGIYQAIASSLPNGTLTITRGTPAASGWGFARLNYNPATDTTGRYLKTWIGSEYFPYGCYSTSYDLTDNIAPPPPTDISGSFSMDFHCVSSVNTAYESHWTWYYTITGTNPSWTLTTTNLVKNTETGTPVTDLSFGGNGHIVNGAVIPFTWTSGTIPDADLFADWGGGGILCEDGPKDLIANF